MWKVNGALYFPRLQSLNKRPLVKSIVEVPKFMIIQKIFSHLKYCPYFIVDLDETLNIPHDSFSVRRRFTTTLIYLIDSSIEALCRLPIRIYLQKSFVDWAQTCHVIVFRGSESGFQKLGESTFSYPLSGNGILTVVVIQLNVN